MTNIDKNISQNFSNSKTIFFLLVCSKLFLGNKWHCCTVHAVSFTSWSSRSVVKNMAEMDMVDFAFDLGSLHHGWIICNFENWGSVQWFRKWRPACSRMELVFWAEKCNSWCDTYVESFGFVVVIGIFKWWFGSWLVGDVELFWSQFRFIFESYWVGSSWSWLKPVQCSRFSCWFHDWLNLWLFWRCIWAMLSIWRPEFWMSKNVIDCFTLFNLIDALSIIKMKPMSISLDSSIIILKPKEIKELIIKAKNHLSNIWKRLWQKSNNENSNTIKNADYRLEETFYTWQGN